jgi:uncharacterized protein YjbJ (UPF0337 family)
LPDSVTDELQVGDGQRRHDLPEVHGPEFPHGQLDRGHHIPRPNTGTTAWTYADGDDEHMRAPGSDSVRSLNWGRMSDRHHRRDQVMSMGDKIKHAGEEAVGKVKEGTGKVTGNEDLEARGEAEQAKADVKQAGDSVKDVAKDVLGN